MPSMKAIKHRITSVSNTQQIMKAMNLVAASKVQRNKAKFEAVSPMFVEAKKFMTQGLCNSSAWESVYYETRAVKNTAYVVISGDRGLCGSYNANVLKEALSHMDSGKNEHIIAIGAKCKEYFVRRKKNIAESHIAVMENISYSLAESIAQGLINMYLERRVDEIYIAYTQFDTLLSHTPTLVKLLPFEPLRFAFQKEVLYEPDVHTYFKKSMPVYLAMFLYGAMVESTVCEQASRMTSMDAASRNAGEIVDDLALKYNRQRQGAITQEISEIVGGANAI